MTWTKKCDSFPIFSWNSHTKKLNKTSHSSKPHFLKLDVIYEWPPTVEWRKKEHFTTFWVVFFLQQFISSLFWFSMLNSHPQLLNFHALHSTMNKIKHTKKKSFSSSYFHFLFFLIFLKTFQFSFCWFCCVFILFTFFFVYHHLSLYHNNMNVSRINSKWEWKTSSFGSGNGGLESIFGFGHFCDQIWWIKYNPFPHNPYHKFSNHKLGFIVAVFNCWQREGSRFLACCLAILLRSFSILAKLPTYNLAPKVPFAWYTLGFTLPRGYYRGIH